MPGGRGASSGIALDQPRLRGIRRQTVALAAGRWLYTRTLRGHAAQSALDAASS